MPIQLIDFSQTVISSITANIDEIKGNNFKDLAKHIVLNQLLALKRKFGGDIIICCDAKTYWRKDEFPHYKGHRKHKKDTGIDWDMVYEVMNELKLELTENFPYRLLEVDGAEADDIIAVLTKYFDENELNTTGVVEVPQDVVICSSDKDYVQLQKYRNVKQWSNIQKCFVTSKNPSHDLIEMICAGQPKDNIPNIMSGDDWAKSRADDIPVRAKSFMSVRLESFYAKGYDACLNESEQRNFRRNEMLIDFDKIPSEISDRIIKAYLSSEIIGNKKKIFEYLTKHRMKLLLSHHSEF